VEPRTLINALKNLLSVVRQHRWMIATFAVTFMGFALSVLRSLPAIPPEPRAASVLGLVHIPKVGPAWVELGDADGGRGRPVFGVHSIHPEIRIFRETLRPRWWTIERVHPPNPDMDPVEARMEWDGFSFRHQPHDDVTNRVLLPTMIVTGMVKSESKAGFRILERGITVEWSSVRPRWAEPTDLDDLVEQDSERLDGESWSDFFETVGWMFGKRLGLGPLDWLLDRDSLFGVWPCKHWQVVYHRSAKAVSVLHVCHRNVGGVHGNTHVSHSNFIDGPAGLEWLDFAALFQHPFGWQDEVRRLLLDDLRRQGASWTKPEGPPPSIEGFQTRVIGFSEEELAELKFTVSSDGVFVHFEEYEAGSYAEGDYVVLLSWKTLSPWARPDVMEAFATGPALPGMPLESLPWMGESASARP